MDDQKGFIIGVGSCGCPVEGSSDHCFVVDYRELVVQLVTPSQPGGADSLQWRFERPIVCLKFAKTVGEFHSQQIKHL